MKGQTAKRSQMAPTARSSNRRITGREVMPINKSENCSADDHRDGKRGRLDQIPVNGMAGFISDPAKHKKNYPTREKHSH
jgi:hypothetical protein